MNVQPLANFTFTTSDLVNDEATEVDPSNPPVLNQQNEGIARNGKKNSLNADAITENTPTIQNEAVGPSDETEQQNQNIEQERTTVEQLTNTEITGPVVPENDANNSKEKGCTSNY